MYLLTYKLITKAYEALLFASSYVYLTLKINLMKFIKIEIKIPVGLF